MVGIRIEPDNNDIVVWKLDESSAPFINSSTSTSAPSHAISDISTSSGTIIFQQPSPFAPNGTNSAMFFSGNNSGSPRNFISGANNFEPVYPITISWWMYLRSYNNSGFVQHIVNKQHTAGVWSGVTFSVWTMQNQSTGSSTYSIYSNGITSTPTYWVMPLNTWCHVGVTYDGATVNNYLNGNLVQQYTGTGSINYGGHGPWFVGAIPSGSGNPEESAVAVCDIRVADIVRDQAYFQNIYQKAILNNDGQISVFSTFYKLRAYDLYYTKTPVYWVDTSISYTNAPASPSGSGLGPIEVMDSWNVLNT